MRKGEEDEENQALIPGLPEDVAIDCLSRVPHRFHSRIRPVCRKWRDLVASPSFRRNRHRISVSEDLLLLVQATDTPPADPLATGESKDPPAAAVNTRPPIYSLTLCNASLNTWHRIPTPDPIPMFSQCAAVGDQLVLVGGWDPTTLDPVADVRILDLATMAWRRGRPMSSARSFFACAAVGGTVYVAGGHDAQKNALRSAEAYDVAVDQWVSLPPMAEERDEAKGVVIGGDFWAVSGYSTENQGRFAASAERYDPIAGQWKMEDGVWDDATCASCFGFGERIWSVDCSRGVREFDGREWKAVGPAPGGLRSSTCAAVVGSAGDRVIVTGGDGNGAWVADLRGRKWERVDSPVGFCGFVYSAAAVRV